MIQLNIKTKKKVVVFIATMILLMIMISSMLFYWYGKTIMSVKYSFSELYGTDFTLEKDEQKNIQSILRTLKIEDSYFFGFSNNTNITIDFYKANALVKTAKLIPGYDIDSLKQNFSLKVKDGLYKMSKNSDDIYDLTAITDANVIRYLEIGGDKDDSAT